MPTKYRYDNFLLNQPLASFNIAWQIYVCRTKHFLCSRYINLVFLIAESVLLNLKSSNIDKIALSFPVWSNSWQHNKNELRITNFHVESVQLLLWYLIESKNILIYISNSYLYGVCSWSNCVRLQSLDSRACRTFCYFQ